MHPSSALVQVFQAAYDIFNICISPEYEEHFLKLSDQRRVFLNINTAFWDSRDCFDLSRKWHPLSRFRGGRISLAPLDFSDII